MTYAEMSEIANCTMQGRMSVFCSKNCKKCRLGVDNGLGLRYNNDVAGSNTPGRHMEYAAVAHLVERHLAKVEVASSSLVGRSIYVEV